MAKKPRNDTEWETVEQPDVNVQVNLDRNGQPLEAERDAEIDMSKLDYKLEQKPSWRNRRKVIFWSLVFCAGTWIWLLGLAPLLGITVATSIAESAITMSAFLAGSVIGGYVFGATWEAVGMGRK